MSLKPKNPTWNAKPHTIAKIAILKSYLDAYFPILGQSKFDQDLVFIDGFAGPGEYNNYPEGSPIAALNSAIKVRSSLDSRWRAGKIHFAFIEKERPQYEHLLQKTDEFKDYELIRSGKIKIHCFSKSFEDGIPEVKQQLPNAFYKWPLFAFIDPFGATGAPFSSIAEILQSPCSEVLINLDTDGIARNFWAGNENTLTRVFGDNSWQQHLSPDPSSHETCERILELYKKKLRALPGVRYVFSFEMRSARVGLVNYHLVFASKNPLGLDKMKEAMRKIDPHGSYQFCDAEVGQGKIFRFDDVEDWAPAFYKKFAGRPVPKNEIWDYALLETPFGWPNKVLSFMEKHGMIISVESTEPRKSSFDRKKIVSVTFK